MLLSYLKKYIFNILVSLDQFGNTITGGDPDETISSRLGKSYKNSIGEKFVNKLFFWQKNHCKNAIEPDEGKNGIIK